MISMRDKQAPILEFPVVVCNSFDYIYRVDFVADSDPERVTENFQFEIDYAYLDETNKRINEYLLVDFVEFGKLKTFVDTVREDAMLANFCRTLG